MNEIDFMKISNNPILPYFSAILLKNAKIKYFDQTMQDNRVQSIF